MAESTRILIADDHTLFREALRDSLEIIGGFDVVGEAGNGEETVSVAARQSPDVVLLDVAMPAHEPVVTVRRLVRLAFRPKVIIVTMHDDLALLQHMLAAGAHGYLHKGVSTTELVNAINAVQDGYRNVVLLLHDRTSGQYERCHDARLSRREVQIVELVAQAMSNRQIASQLAISEGTVKRHLRNIFEKLGAVSRIDAVNKAGLLNGRWTLPLECWQRTRTRTLAVRG